MTFDRVCRVLAGTLAMAGSGNLLANTVGHVTFASGDTEIVAADGARRPPAKGMAVESGEKINTRGGRVQLRFNGGSFISLQPQSQLGVEERKPGEKGGDDRIQVNLLKGGVRAVVERNDAKFTFRTPAASIQTAAAQFAVRYGESMEVFSAEGSLSVENEQGTLTLLAGEAAGISTAQASPERTASSTWQSVSSDRLPVTRPGIDPPSNAVGVVNLTSLAQISPLTGDFDGNYAWASRSLDGSWGQTAPISIGMDGVPRSMDVGFETLAVGSATPEPLGNDGIVAWGRFVGGRASWRGFETTLNLPLHYVVGAPALNMPVLGAAVTNDYSMIGSTSSCIDGCTGLSVESSSLRVNFANYSVKLNMALNVVGTFNGGRYVFTQTGGGGLDVRGKFGINGNLVQVSEINPLSGPIFGLVGAAGFLAGNGVPRAGVAIAGEIYGHTNYKLDGVIAYTKK